MKNLIVDWDFLRLLRLGIGLWLGFQAIAESQLIVGVMAALFLLQAIFNIGCAGGACNTPRIRANHKHLIKEEVFEEIK